MSAHIRAGRFWHRVPSKEQGKGPPERTKRAGAVSRTEDASGAAVGCPQSVESAVLRAFEDASRTVGGRFRYRISLPYRRSLFFTPNASENASRTPASLFSTARMFRTVEGGFWYGALPKTHRTWLSGVLESGWQLPLRGLSTPGRGRGKFRRSGVWRTF